MNKWVIGIIAAVVVAAGAVFALAQMGRSDGGRHLDGKGHSRGEFMMRGLDLTDEQKAQAKSIQDASEEKLKGVHEAQIANREKLKAATANGAFDDAAVSAIATEHGALAAQMMLEHARTRSQIFAILTDEQKAKFQEMPDRGMERKMGGRGGRHGRAGVNAPADSGL